MLVQCCMWPSAAQQIMRFYQGQACECVCSYIRDHDHCFHTSTCVGFMCCLYSMPIMPFVCAESLSVIPVQYTLWTFLKCQLINLSAPLSLAPPPFAAWWCSEPPLSVCFILHLYSTELLPLSFRGFTPHCWIYSHLFTLGTLSFRM